MIDIEEELAVLAVDSLEHSYRFFGCYKEVALVVYKNVERLENYHNALFFSDMGHFRESLYAYLELFFAGHVKSFVAAFSTGDKKTAITQLAAVAIAVTLCFSTGADMFSALGIAFDWPTIGVVLTGIFLSRGSNYISDFIKKMRGVSQNDN